MQRTHLHGSVFAASLSALNNVDAVNEDFHKASVEDVMQWAVEEKEASTQRPVADWTRTPYTSMGYQQLRRVRDDPPKIYVATGKLQDGMDLPSDHYCGVDVGTLYSIETTFLHFVLGTPSLQTTNADEADYVYFPHCATTAYFIMHAPYMEHVQSGHLSLEALQNDTNRASFLRPIVAAMDQFLLAGVLADRVRRSASAHACLERKPFGRCRLLFVNFLGRTWLPEFSRAFPDAVFVSNAAESRWLAHGGGQEFHYWGKSNQSSAFAKGERPASMSKVEADSANPRLVMRGLTGLARLIVREAWFEDGVADPTSQQDIPLPLPVEALWTSRSSAWDDRPLLAAFAGALNSDIRRALFRLFGDAGVKDVDDGPGFHVNGQWQRAERPRPDVKLHGSETRLRIGDASKLMYSSKLCLVPDGDQPNTERLVQASAHGCVPLVISSKLVPPFRRLIAWRKCAIFLREEDVDRLPELLDELERSPKLLRDMHDRLEMLTYTLLYGGMTQQSWGFHAFLIAELRHRRDEGVVTRQCHSNLFANRTMSQKRIRAKHTGRIVGDKYRTFQWFASSGGSGSSEIDFWNMFLLPPEDGDRTV